MLKTSKLLTITVPKPVYTKVKQEAKKRDTTISGLLREAFFSYIQKDISIYSDKELALLLKRDQLSPVIKKKLDILLTKGM